MIFITSIESTSLIANLHNVFTSPIFPRINAIISRTNVYIGQSLVHIRLIYIYIHERYIIAWNLTTVALFGTPAWPMYQVASEKVNWFYIKLRVTTFRHAAVVREKLPGLYSETSKHVASIPLWDSKGLIESFNAFVRYPYLSLTASFPAFILIIRFNEIRYVEEFNKPLLSSVDNYEIFFPPVRFPSTSKR